MTVSGVGLGRLGCLGLVGLCWFRSLELGLAELVVLRELVGLNWLGRF